MITLKVLTRDTELSDGLSLRQARVYVYSNGFSVSYVPLDPNPLGHKARLVIVNADTGTIEIDNYERLSVALWNYADYLPEPGELMTEADELFKAGL
jgi:dUTPase